MQDAALQPSWAVGIDAAIVHLAFRAVDGAVAHRAPLRHCKGLVPARVVLVFDDLDDFGDHGTAALDQDPVANLYSQAFDFVLVVERGTGDGGPANRHGREPGNGGQLARAAYLCRDVLYLRGSAAGSVLVGDGPSRGFSRE